MSQNEALAVAVPDQADIGMIRHVVLGVVLAHRRPERRRGSRPIRQEEQRQPLRHGRRGGRSRGDRPGQQQRQQARQEQERARAAEQARRVREQAERHVRTEVAPAPRPPEDDRVRAPVPPAPAGQEPDGAKADAQGKADAEAVPADGFPGLTKGLPRPVQGEIQGRFGAQRPEGGLWRGIVLRAATGTSVRAVAAGRVESAHWVCGFGSLLIIGHGRQYLSIYAYNQSLLRQVGDVVARGDEVARVGATGGQVEPGLYFELRHQGAPINPEVWLK